MSTTSPRRRAAPLLALFVALIAAPCALGDGRVYSKCDIFDTDISSSVLSEASEAARAICEVATKAFEKLEKEENKTITVDGEEVAVGDLDVDEDIAISTSSVDSVPFTVIGGEGSGVRPVGGVLTRKNPDRPSGPWISIVSTDVDAFASLIYLDLRKPRTLFRIGFEGLSVTSVEEEKNGDIVATQPRGRKIIFEEVGRDNGKKFHIQRIKFISEGVLPGFNLNGSTFYVQVSSEGFLSRASNIELGWYPGEDFAAGGDITIGARLVENLLIQFSRNFEREYGIRCEATLNVRTIEGTCNNLENPEQGVAGGPLRRLREGIDPAFPKGDPRNPSGPLNVNVRDVSNALFAMSPGIDILNDQAKNLKKTCMATKSTDGTEYLVCPFRYIETSNSKKKTADIIPFNKIFFNECEDLVFQFVSEDCTIDILLRCSGEKELQLAEDPCFAETNRLLDPAGCTTVPAADDVLSNSASLTDIFFTFAQFIDHDYGLSPASQINPDQPGFSTLLREDVEIEFPIEVPENDFHFNRSEMEFKRVEFTEEVPDSQENLHSSYLDASQIYGIDADRARLLRSFRDGKLALSSGNLPPFNGFGFPGSLGGVVANGPNTANKFFVAGDPRAQEQILLLMMHIIWLREHNRVADLVQEAYPNFDDELIYQTARAIVTAEYQCIVYNEWLPLLLGKNAPNAKDFKYDEELDATVSAIFTTSAFRFGHTLVGTNLMKMGPGSKKNSKMNLIPIRAAFFSPGAVEETREFGDGVDAFLRGGAWHLCKELDHKIVDELRNFLIIEFAEDAKEIPFFDLISINLQRGRDMGLPSLNGVRELFGLKPYKSFSDFVKDPNLADAAAKVYNGDVDIVEPFFGLVEEHIAESQLGETFNTVIADQFRRSRDGDRFFYTGIKFDDELIKKIPLVKDIINHKVKLRDIIVHNSGITDSELGRRETVFKL